jgi:GcrA cell cycle regulator
MTAHEWTAEMTKAFAALHRARPPMSFAEIASAMSTRFDITLTRNACIGKARRMGLATRDNIPRAIIEKRRIRRMKTKVDAPIAPREAERPVAPAPEGLDIYQLREGDCRWPLGKMHDHPPFRYCGDAALLGRPYCSQHARRAYNA